MALIMVPYSKISCFSGTLLVIKRKKKKEQSEEGGMGKNPALNPRGQARCLSILPTSLSIVHLQHSPTQGVFLAEDGRRARSRQVKLLCGQSSWQLPVNPVGFVFFLELPCSETLIYMWPVVSSWHMPDFRQASGDLLVHENPSRRASRAVAEIPVPGKNVPLS